MTDFMNALSSYSAHVMVSADRKEGGFTLSLGLLGQTFRTSPALTRQILESPEFDQLLGSERALRVLELVLARAQQ